MSAPTAAPAKKKSKLKMPHLLFLMLGLILLMSLLTYIVPAGQFATDPETGALIGDEFHLLGHQTPVNIWQALNYILPGFMNSSYVISLLLISGGCVGVIMGTGRLRRDGQLGPLQTPGQGRIGPGSHRVHGNRHPWRLRRR